MKFKLTLQALSPLFLFLFIQNFGKWNIEEVAPAENPFIIFVSNNWYIIMAELLLCIFILLSIIFYFSFNTWSKYGKETHEPIKNMKNINDQSLLFFTSYILPIVVSDFTDFRSVIICTLLILLIFILLMKTNLYFQNPLLVIIGYNIYEILIKEKIIIAIVKGQLKSSNILKKQITDNIYVVRGVKNDH